MARKIGYAGGIMGNVDNLNDGAQLEVWGQKFGVRVKTLILPSAFRSSADARVVTESTGIVIDP